MNLDGITILIPCYNKSKFYNGLFKNLLNQKDKNFKIIFLDDKSLDDTSQRLYEFQNQNPDMDIKIISLKTNGGISNARNVLIDNVKTKYFYFLDPDDIIKRKTFFYFNKLIQNDEYDIIAAKNSLSFCNWLYLPNVLDNFGRTIRKIKSKKSVAVSYVEDNFPFVWNKVINTEWFKSLNINFAIGHIYEDLSFMPVLFMLSRKTYFLNKITYQYGIHIKSLSKGHSPNKVRDISYNLRVLYKRLESNKLKDFFKNETAAEMKLIPLIFLHLFSGFYLSKILKNFSEYEKHYRDFFEIVKKEKLEDLMNKRVKWFNFLFKGAFKNYKKIKKLLNELDESKSK